MTRTVQGTICGQYRGDRRTWRAVQRAIRAERQRGIEVRVVDESLHLVTRKERTVFLVFVEKEIPLEGAEYGK